MTLEDARADLDWVAEYWPDLIEARLPLATARPRQPRMISPDIRAARDALARLERQERTGLALGESPAPMDVDVLQTALDLVVRADDLAAAVAEHAGVPMLPPPRSIADHRGGPAFAPSVEGGFDARPYLAYASVHLTEDLAEWAASAARRMVEQVAGALGMVYDGQELAVVCPWCAGITADRPDGGEHTWRVRTLPGDQVAIVCESGSCSPPLREVGTWWQGAPCWPLPDWGRLARLVEAR
ncbi:hypothetical protein [Microtetraspora malaysiensis]|uniref:hypothetical protein n=1 Tax=Microtetraspora malaysiensis TaxID=161358 RepID=UPI003D8D0F79